MDALGRRPAAACLGPLIVVLSAIIVGCNDSSSNLISSEPPAAVLAVTVDGSAGPILRTLDVRLEGSAAVEVSYWSDDAPALIVTGDAVVADHRIPLLRLRATTPYRFRVVPVDDLGERGDPFEGEFQTDSLPADLAAIELQTIGIPTFPLVMLEIDLPRIVGAPVIVDADGRIVWYRTEAARTASGVTQRANGDFVFRTNDGLEVVTPTNERVATLTQDAAAARTGLDPYLIHHDVIASLDDKLLFLVQDTTMVNDTVWTGEAIWEWDPETDVLARRWRSADFLSPITDRGDRTRPGDWLHANSLSIGPRGNIIVSLFWLHEVLSIAPDYQSLEWRLGGPASTFHVTDGGMEAGQHTAAEVSTDRILLFDNGRDRPNGELFSRALELQIDRTDGTAGIVWQFRPHPDIYAPIQGSARRLPNGNTVVGFALTEGLFDPPTTGPIAVYEVTSANRVLWFLRVDGITRVYRATPMQTIGGEVEAG